MPITTDDIVLKYIFWKGKESIALKNFSKISKISIHFSDQTMNEGSIVLFIFKDFFCLSFIFAKIKVSKLWKNHLLIYNLYFQSIKSHYLCPFPAGDLQNAKTSPPVLGASDRGRLLCVTQTASRLTKWAAYQARTERRQWLMVRKL